MTPKRFMLIAGEASGDILAAELVEELRKGMARRPTYSTNVQPLQSDLAPTFFGAGGPRMVEAGVDLLFDLTQYSITGLPSVRDFFKFRSLLHQLIAVAKEREPHVIVCVDFPLVNGLFAAAIKKYVHERRGTFNNWEPKIIKYISPQVWASREGRSRKIARDFDLLLTIFPFEKDWYAARVPQLPVEFVGHPLVSRYGFKNLKIGAHNPQAQMVLLLPGSRPGELRRHLPVMLDALKIIRSIKTTLRSCMVLPTQPLLELARKFELPPELEVRVGGLAEAMAETDLAIASTGTVTMECAFFKVPTVTLYKTSWTTYQLGKRMAKVKWLTMPNLLAKQEVFPEFIQDAATPENISRAGLELLRDAVRREQMRVKLTEVIHSLGGPGASQRAADAILKII